MASYAGAFLLGLLAHASAALLFILPSADTDAPRTQLVFVGDGPVRASLQALCVALWRPCHIHRPAHGQAPQQTFASADIMGHAAYLVLAGEDAPPHRHGMPSVSSSVPN
ncbi:hypothetical protein K438DRAFT_1985409 [Mycena galopus ATCC 62051]|nr:hypothetical protein K438DRAFT_1985409 [Mycena galopus ATCC 62051]